MSAIRRFWDQATVDAGDAGFAVLLDAKPMRIPGGAPLVVQGQALARAIAAEWQAAGGAKGGALTMDDVPLTRLAGTAQDRIAPDPAPVAEALACYAETDLLCYRAGHPEPLVIRQARLWQPWLDWLDRRHGARLEPREGVMFLPQDPAALQRVQQVMAAQSPAALAALGIAIPILGSAVLGLALADGALDAAEAHALASLDEVFEVEAWGEDAEGRARREAGAADVAMAERFLRLSAAP
jgi:chaperone required for assembly of F1-ATPase